MRRRLALLVVLVIVLVAVGLRSSRQLAAHQRTVAACEALDAGNAAKAEELSRDLVSDSPDGLAAAECRCQALVALERGEACVDIYEGLAGAWLPGPVLALEIATRLRDRGALVAAADLARRTRQAHPTALQLWLLEANTRMVTEPPEAVLDELLVAARGLPPEESYLVRLVLARLHLGVNQYEQALAVLGEQGPPIEAPQAWRWYRMRAAALGTLGRLEEFDETMAALAAQGLPLAELQAHRGLAMSEAGLNQEGYRPVEHLERALTAPQSFTSEQLLEEAYQRLIMTHYGAGDHEAAIQVYDAAAQHIDIDVVAREDLERAGALQQLDAGGIGLIQVHSPIAGQLYVSPPPTEPPDRPYERLSISPQRPARISRGPAILPVRWVFRDEGGDVRASGTIWPEVAGTRQLTIEPREPSPAPSRDLAPRPADGQRKVLALVLDCGDWRLIQHLRTRGELPVLDELAREGFTAVVHSEPAFTGAAMRSLVRPSEAEDYSVLRAAHAMGVELAGLAEVGRNPLSFLGAFLPDNPDLFATLGEGDHVAANLLFSHGGIDAGEHAQMIGPRGHVSKAPSIPPMRPLTPVERAVLQGAPEDVFEPIERYPIGGQVDAAVAFAQSEWDADFLFLRIESLDLMTHAWFAETLRSGQQDGQQRLFWVYRYLDHQLARVASALDGDDVLVVMSDHGIIEPMRHDEASLFIVWSPQPGAVPQGRAEGRPEIEGVPAVLARLLGVETDWPRTGVAPWLLGDGLDE